MLGIGIAELGRAAARRRVLLPALAVCAIGAAAAGRVAGPARAGGSTAAGGTSLGAVGADPTALRIAVVAAAAAVALVLAAAFGRRRSALAAAAAGAIVVAALAVPVATARQVVRSGAGDSAIAGHMPAATLDPLRAYLRAHQHGARYEVAGASILKEAGLIIRDGRPVLTLTGPAGRQLVSPDALLRLVRAGQVRYALLGATPCAPGGRGAGCAAVVQYVRATATDVSLQAGLAHRGILFRL